MRIHPVRESYPLADSARIPECMRSSSPVLSTIILGLLNRLFQFFFVIGKQRMNLAVRFIADSVYLRTTWRTHGCGPRGSNLFSPGRIRWREYLHGDDDSRNEISEGHPNPHHGAGEFLVPQRRNIEELRARCVCGIDDATAKSEKCRERIARYRGEEQIQGNKPPMPPRDTWPRLDDRPPEKQPGNEKTCLLEVMPNFGLET